MTWDDTMLGALKVYARNNLWLTVLGGAMSPVSVAAHWHKHWRQSGIACQTVNPGAP